MTWTTWATVLLALAIAGGIVTTWVGWRGRRVNDHPLCRRCGFDLTGRPDTSTRCAECGADLSGPRATRIGLRRRRPGLIVGGTALLLLAVAPLAGVGLVRARGTDLNTLKPTWLLARGALAGDVAAWGELRRRLAVGALSGEQVARLVDDALAWQADVDRAWVPAAGDFVEAARDATVPPGAPRRVPDEKWARYIRQAPQVTFAARRRIRAGDPLPIAMTNHPGRSGSTGRLTGGVRRPTLTGPTGPTTTRPIGRILMSADIDLGPGAGGTYTFVVVPPALAGTGPATAPTTREAVLTFGMSAGERGGGLGQVWSRDVRVSWEDVPASASVVAPVESPQSRSAIERALVVKSVRVSVFHRPADPALATVEFEAGNTPLPLGFDIYLRAGDREWKVGPFVHNGQVSPVPHQGRVSGRTDGLSADRVDVVFRSNPDVAAARSHDIDRIWSGEVVIRDVPVDQRFREMQQRMQERTARGLPGQREATRAGATHPAASVATRPSPPAADDR